MSVYHKDVPGFLDEALKSIWDGQVVKPNQIVLVKDGPLTPELDRVISDWKEKLRETLTIVALPGNRGLGAALNEGLARCNYELVARMDSDDISLPGRFEKQVKFFENNEAAAVIGSDILEFYQGHTMIYSRERNYPSYIDKNSSVLYRGTPLAHPSVMIKTSVLRAYKYNTSQAYSQDIELWFRLLRDNYHIENINEPLLKYRITDNTFHRRNFKKALYEFKIYWKNLYLLHGLSVLLLFPLARFVSRLLPVWVIKKLYFSNLRIKMFNRTPPSPPTLYKYRRLIKHRTPVAVVRRVA